MKRIISLFCLTFLFCVAGCATSNYTVGKDFSSENVKQVEKGKTTNTDLISLFGEPFSKTVISDNEEKWIYMHSNGTANAQSYVLTMKVTATGKQKTLDVLLKNGVVTNFTYNETTTPAITVQ